MTRTLVRILDQRKRSKVCLLLLECGHTMWKKWNGKMSHQCADCLRGMKPQALPPAEPIPTEQARYRKPIVIPPEALK